MTDTEDSRLEPVPDAEAPAGAPSLLEQAGAQALVQQIGGIANAAEMLAVDAYDAVLKRLESDARQARLLSQPHVDALDLQIDVVKAVRHLNRRPHDLTSRAQARATITNVPGPAA